MKKGVIGVILIGLFLSLTFLSSSYYQYRDYYKPDNDYLFFYIPVFLNTYSMVNSGDAASYSKDDLYSFIDSYYNDSIFIDVFPTIRFLKKHKANIRFHYYPDSNYFILYDIGIDGRDDSLQGKVFENLPYYYPLIRSKGDILLGYSSPTGICDNENSNNWFFKNGERVAVKPMDSIITDNVYPDVIMSNQKNSAVNDSILLLFRLNYSESNQTWKCKLLCNWSQTDPELVEQISDDLVKNLSEKKFHVNADSIIYNFKYWNMNERRVSDP